jgi:hypothetical protein
LEVFEGFPQGVRAGVFFKTQSWRKLRKDKAFKVVEGSTGSLCIGNSEKALQVWVAGVEYRGKTTW